MRYTCLLIDHDDTTVDSTPSIHHPAHIAQMKRLGREELIMSLEDWFRINYSPGLRPYIDEVFGLSEAEKQVCHEVWREHTTTATPPFFPGMLAFLQRYRERGGVITVVSHSEEDIIRRHYASQNEVPGFMPDLIIGWNGDGTKNKPYTWPVERVLEEFELERKDLLVVDDLQPGITMARNAGVDSVAVGWSHGLEEIKQDISRKSTYYADTIAGLEAIVFGSTGNAASSQGGT
jgi:phosphoglycolate phosphatase/pyrophosphatase PpaX